MDGDSNSPANDITPYIMNVPCRCNVLASNGYVLTTMKTNEWAANVVIPPTKPRTFCGYNSPIITHGTTRYPSVQQMVKEKIQATGIHVCCAWTGGTKLSK